MAATAKDNDGSAVDSDAASAPTAHAHAKRPGLGRRYNTTDSQTSDLSNQHHHNQHHHRAKHTKHVVGGGSSARIPMHGRVPSSKALHKHTSASTTKLASKRNQSPSPDRSAAPAPSAAAQPSSSHRRSTSDVKLASRDSSSSNLRKNASHSSLVGKRNRSSVEIGKKSKSAANIKRSSSNKDVRKLQQQQHPHHGPKGSVHFALGDNDGDDQEDEWVDASGSASPYLSRRGSVASGHQSPGKSRPQTPHEQSEEPIQEEAEDKSGKAQKSGNLAVESSDSASVSDRETIQHKEYLTSRLLKRTPSYCAPGMTKETASRQPRTGSPDSVRASLYGTPKNASQIVGSDQTVDVTSRFVNGSGAEPGSFYSPKRSPGRRADTGVRPSQSLSNLNDRHRDSIDAAEDEDSSGNNNNNTDSALAPRTTRPARRGVPAENSRTQQKLNLQRASSSIEPTQPSVVSGVAGSGALVGVSSHDSRDPRISRQLERTGSEYLVVRRYQNPIARSINRLSHLPNARKTQQIRQPKSTNGLNGGVGHARKPSHGLSQSLQDTHKSRPTTPAAPGTAAAARSRPTSIRTNGARSSFGDDEDHNVIGTLYGNEGGDDDGGLAAILRNLWDKNMDLSASQD